MLAEGSPALLSDLVAPSWLFHKDLGKEPRWS